MTRNPMLLFGAVLFAILSLALLLKSAMDQGGWMFAGFIAGLVTICAVTAWVISFVVKQYVQWTEAHIKSKEINNNFVLAMAKIGRAPDGTLIGQIDAPQQVKPDPVIDPRHDLLISLCLLTIRSNGYGPNSDRLMTADDAQACGGRFADRTNWDRASKYGQEIGMLYTKIGGAPKDQGLKINGNSAGGRTVTDLLETLHARDVITDSAVNALPGVVR